MLDGQIACHYILSGDANLLINVVPRLERNSIDSAAAGGYFHRRAKHARVPKTTVIVDAGRRLPGTVSTRGRGIEAENGA